MCVGNIGLSLLLGRLVAENDARMLALAGQGRDQARDLHGVVLAIGWLSDR